MPKARGTGFSFDKRPAPKGHSRQPSVKPLIILEEEDITSYLYGRSARIITEHYPTREALVSIRDQVRKQPYGASQFGVRLSAPRPNEVRSGDLLLVLDTGSSGITKKIVRVTTANNDGIDTECLYPSWFEGSRGSLLRSILDIDSRLNGTYPVLYLGFHGQIPQGEESFFAKIMILAGEFAVLSHLWASAHEERLRSEPFMNRGPYDGAWKGGFEKKHGTRFKHREVGDLLTVAFEEARIDGINKIYDDTRPWNRVDLITPLLWQMQTDILERLHEDPDLITTLFRDDASEWTRRRLRALFERYYGQKGMTYIPKLDSEHYDTAQTSVEHDDKLLKVINMINRGASEGERAAARAVYRHRTGHDYVA